MGFRSLFKAFRTSYKPGVQEDYLNTPVRDYAYYTQNQNADPLVDRYGVTWTRDAGDPIQNGGPGDSPSQTSGNLAKNTWTTGLAVDHVFVGMNGIGNGHRSAIFKVTAIFGDPTIAWATSPYYLQIFAANNSVLPPPGTVPDFVIPAPRPNEGLGQAYFDFGVKTPFNVVGACVAFSVTPNVYTNPGGVLGDIMVNWAHYAFGS